jgi:hypothetical protein
MHFAIFSISLAVEIKPAANLVYRLSDRSLAVLNDLSLSCGKCGAAF